MSLSWPPRYTSIHELSKIITHQIFFVCLFSFLLHFSSWTVAAAIKICTVILCTVTDSTDSRFDVHFTWHSNDVYNLISESIWNDWLGNKLDFDFSLAAKPWPFFADTFPRDIGARWFQGPSRDQLLWKLEWYGKLMSWWEQTEATEFYLWFLTEKIVWGFTAVTR